MADLLEGVPDTKDHGVLRKDMARFVNHDFNVAYNFKDSKTPRPSFWKK